MSKAATEEEFRMLAEHLGMLIQEIEQDPQTDERVTELLRHTLTLYGEALKRILGLVQDNPVGEITLGQMAEDEIISAVLMIHGLFPVKLETRVLRALDHVREKLKERGADVELLELDGENARVRVTASGGSSLASLQLLVREVVYEEAPDLIELKIEGVLEPGRQTASAGLVQIQISSSEEAWVEVTSAESLAPGRMLAFQLNDVPLLVCRTEEGIFAFKNICAHQRLSMEKGMLRGNTLTCPWHGYRYNVSRQGACLNAPGLKLEEFPVKVDAGAVKVRLRAEK